MEDPTTATLFTSQSEAREMATNMITRVKAPATMKKSNANSQESLFQMYVHILAAWRLHVSSWLQSLKRVSQRHKSTPRPRGPLPAYEDAVNAVGDKIKAWHQALDGICAL